MGYRLQAAPQVFPFPGFQNPSATVKHTMLRKIRARMNVGAMATIGFVAGCANERGPHPDLPPLGVQLEFRSTNLCGQGVSPQIRLGGVPANTATYKLRFTNVTVLHAPRRETTIKADAPIIPEDAIPEFDPPCPGELQTFSYRLEVMALAANGLPLAYGWNFASVHPLTLQIEREQQDAKRVPPPNRSTLPAVRNPPYFVQ